MPEHWANHCLRGISKGFSKDNDFKELFKQEAVKPIYNIIPIF